MTWATRRAVAAGRSDLIAAARVRGCGRVLEERNHGRGRRDAGDAAGRAGQAVRDRTEQAIAEVDGRTRDAGPDAAGVLDDVAAVHVGDLHDDHVDAGVDAVRKDVEHLDAERLRRRAVDRRSSRCRAGRARPIASARPAGRSAAAPRASWGVAPPALAAAAGIDVIATAPATIAPSARERLVRCISGPSSSAPRADVRLTAKRAV